MCSSAAVRASILYRKWLLRQCSIVSCEALRLSATLSLPSIIRGLRGGGAPSVSFFPSFFFFSYLCRCNGEEESTGNRNMSASDSSATGLICNKVGCRCFGLIRLFLSRSRHLSASPPPPHLSLLSQQKSILLHSVCQHFPNYSKFLLLLFLYLLFSLYLDYFAASS